jgi:hypothetical protein
LTAEQREELKERLSTQLLIHIPNEQYIESYVWLEEFRELVENYEKLVDKTAKQGKIFVLLTACVGSLMYLIFMICFLFKIFG